MEGPPAPPPAPELDVVRWFNADEPVTLAGLRGQVIVIEAFQMLCPGCVSHGLPQARRISQTFGDDVTVLGLHTVFEHHEAMGPTSLEAFLHEYRIGFPVGVDRHDRPGGVPVTMERFGLRGTPSLIAIDRNGRIRLEELGAVDDLAAAAAASPIELSVGHVDALAVRYDGAQLGLAVKDDTGAWGPVDRSPAGVVLRALAPAKLEVPDLPQFGFLGAPGDPIWMLPEVAEPGVLWPGFSTEGLPWGVFADDEVRVDLVGVDGPAEVSLFTCCETDSPDMIFDQGDGLPDSLALRVGTHMHANWAFEAEGEHVLTFEVSALPVGGGPRISTGPIDYRFLIGDDAGPSAPLVRALYQTVLGRQVDLVGLDHWEQRFSSGTDPIVLANGLARSGEGYRQVVRHLYRQGLQRSPDPAGLSYWAGKLAREGRPDALVGQLLSSNEAQTRAGGAGAPWVNYVFQQVLLRNPDPSGLAYWTRREEGTAPMSTERRKAVATLLRSDEATRKAVMVAGYAACPDGITSEEVSTALRAEYLRSNLKPLAPAGPSRRSRLPPSVSGAIAAVGSLGMAAGQGQRVTQRRSANTRDRHRWAFGFHRRRLLRCEWNTGRRPDEEAHPVIGQTPLMAPRRGAPRWGAGRDGLPRHRGPAPSRHR